MTEDAGDFGSSYGEETFLLPLPLLATPHTHTLHPSSTAVRASCVFSTCIGDMCSQPPLTTLSLKRAPHMQLKHSTINKQILVSPHDRVGGPGVRRAMDMRLGEEDEQEVCKRLDCSTLKRSCDRVRRQNSEIFTAEHVLLLF